MNNLEILKMEYMIIKDKLMLFTAGFGGSVAYVSTSKIAFLNIGAGILACICFSGMLLNLFKAGKIQKALNQLKEELSNE